MLFGNRKIGYFSRENIVYLLKIISKSEAENWVLTLEIWIIYCFSQGPFRLI